MTSRDELLDKAVFDDKAVILVTELAFVSGNKPSPPRYPTIPKLVL